MVARVFAAAVLLSLALLCPITTRAGDAAAVDARYSAHWYVPERDGEGWMLEILSAEQALLYWFTYDENGDQRWLISVGRIDGERIDFPELVVTSGGRFGPDFDPDEVVRTVAGSGSMRFSDCRHGVFQYQAFGQSQQLPIRRLTSVAGLGCEDMPPAAGRAGQSGSWYDPAHDGEGYTFQWLDEEQVLLIWFSYDADGGQYWMLDVGRRHDGLLRFSGMHAARGARFGTAFDPADVERFPWGELKLDIRCDGGRADYASVLPAFGSGHLQLVPLTRLRGLDCLLPPPADFIAANWQQPASNAPALSELPAVTLGMHIYLAGGLRTISENRREFWRYTPASNSWTQLPDLPEARDHGMMAVADDRIYFFGGYLHGPVAHEAADDTWSFAPGDPQWRIQAQMPRARAAGSAVVIDDAIYLAGGPTSGIDRYDPASDSWTAMALTDTVSRDHAAAVAFRGDLWLIGGRDDFSGIPHRSVRIFDPRTGESRPGPDLNDPRSGFAAAVVSDRILVAGGEGFAPAPYLTPSAEVYDPTSGQWHVIAEPPVSVHGGPGAEFDGRFYLLLGSTRPGTAVNPATVQILPPASAER